MLADEAAFTDGFPDAPLVEPGDFNWEEPTPALLLRGGSSWDGRGRLRSAHRATEIWTHDYGHRCVRNP